VRFGEVGEALEVCRLREGEVFKMKKIRDFRELRVWVKALDLAEKVYGVTKGFPKSELYGLTSQLRRAVASISSNIAEGCGRRTSRDFVGFLYNAMGSAREVQSQLLLSVKVGYLNKEEVEILIGDFNELLKMLMRFVEFVLSEDVK